MRGGFLAGWPITSFGSRYSKEEARHEPGLEETPISARQSRRRGCRASNQSLSTKLVPASRGLTLMFALKEGLSFGQVLAGALHEVGLGLRATKAVGVA